MPWPRLIAGIVGLSVLLALPAAPAAKPRNSPTPPMDTATATGDNLILDDYGSVEIEVDAHSGPSGENPGGHVSFVAGQILPISGPVTCLNVSGNTALMTVSPTGSFVDFALVRVVDNGGSGLDRFEYIWAPPPLQISSNCHVDLPPLFGGPLIGRAVVNDRQSPPPGPTCMGKEVTITLNSNGQPIGAANDNVEGTDGDDVINTGSGDDLVDAASGNDLICTGDGVDRVLDGGGNDRIEAGPGRDRLSLGGGDDVADAGNGNNLILDGEGDDTYVAGSGDDKVVDGRGDDRVKTGPGEDTVRGDSGENTFRLGAGNDAAVGGIGNEVILGGTGVDYLLGSRGDDTLRGGGGDDNSPAIGNKKPHKNGRIAGGAGADKIFGGGGDDLLLGNAGADKIFGQSGDDDLDGGSQRDLCSGGRGFDRGSKCELLKGINDPTWAPLGRIVPRER